MSTPEIVVATPQHRDRIVASLVAAFAKDPVLRHLFPDDETYPEHAAAFFGHLFDKRVHRGSVWTVGGGASVAIREPPPGVGTDGAGGAVPEMRLPPAAMARVRAYEDAVHAVLPKGPYWYLGVLGTHPESTGRRWGHAVMSAGLRRAAEDGLPAVLETSTPGNVEMYNRAGWKVVATVTDPLPIWVLSQLAGEG